MSNVDVEALRQENISQRDHVADALAITSVFASTLEAPETTYSPGFAQKGPILEVGFSLYSQFRYNAEQAGKVLPWVDVEHGYHVCATGVQKCWFAYQRYCRDQAVEFDESVLLSGLQNPKTIQFFTKISKISGVENREYETLFNFWQYEDSDYNEFTYSPDQNYFIPNPILDNDAEEEAAVAKYQLTQAGINESEFGACPATRFIPIIWRDIVQQCADNQLFLTANKP